MHRWVQKSIYYNCDEICMWSSGTVIYQRCKDCGEQRKKRWWNDSEWSPSDEDIDFSEPDDKKKRIW